MLNGKPFVMVYLALFMVLFFSTSIPSSPRAFHRLHVHLRSLLHPASDTQLFVFVL
jgi:hypothetical protein